MDNFITQFGSDIILTPVTIAAGTYGGYVAGTNTDGTPVSTVGIPSNYTTDADGKIIGRLETGDLTMVIKYSETVDKDYKVTWLSNTYSVKEIKSVSLQSTIVAKRLILSRRL